MASGGPAGASAPPPAPPPCPLHHPRPGTQVGQHAQPPLCSLPARSHRSGLTHKESSVWAERWPASLPPAQGHSIQQGPLTPTLLDHQHPPPGRSSSGQYKAVARGTDIWVTLVTWPLLAPRTRAVRAGRVPLVIAWVPPGDTRGLDFKALSHPETRVEIMLAGSPRVSSQPCTIS